MKQIAWIVFVWLVLFSAARATNFDCKKANTNIEKIICSDSELSELDSNVSDVFQQIKEQSENKSNEITEQKQWIKDVRNACQDSDCLKNTYKTRFDELSKRLDSSNKYVVRCDKHTQSITVSASEHMPESEDASSSKDVSEYIIYPNSLTKFGGTEMNPLRLHARQKLYRCQFGRILYTVVIAPNIHNSRMMGECGADEPDILLSIRRNNDEIFSGLEFEKCRGSNAGRSINRVQISEGGNSIKVLYVPDSIFLPVSVERTFTLSPHPLDWEKAIFEDFPTGDASADLFIAVDKRDLAAIKQALQNGANSNTKNLEGFPPLALVNNGHWAAYRDKHFEEFNQVSENIAKILFAAGANGDAENIHGITLLDYLLASNVSISVIDLFLANGVNVKNGTPLKNAAYRGDESLIRKFIDSGVDPNKTGKDGSTALWVAATTGFYSNSNSDLIFPPIAEYAKCMRLLLQHGAKVQGAVRDSMGMPWMLVNHFGNDEKLKIILAELIPYIHRDEIERALKLAEKNSLAIAPWLKEQLH